MCINILDFLNTFEVALQYLSNVVILFKTAFDPKLYTTNDPKTSFFLTVRNFTKTFGTTENST